MKIRLLIAIGIFLMIFGLDGILFLESAIPECRGFTGMGWFVFITLGFNPMAVLSNPDCLTSFYVQTAGAILFVIGFSLIIHLIIKRYKDRISQGVQLENED
jgi:hypothetical protein